MTQFALPGFSRAVTFLAPSPDAEGTRRVMHYFRTFLALKSVVVGLLILFLWGRSYFVGESFHRGTPTQYVQIGSAGGSMLVRFAHDGGPTKLLGTWERDRTSDPRQVLVQAGMGGTSLNRIGLGFNSRFIPQPNHGMIVNIMLPHWLVFLLAIPSAVKWVRRRAKERAESTPFAWCPQCTQEIRDPSDSCPSCGGPVGVIPAMQ